jgi:hypothetical protein
MESNSTEQTKFAFLSIPQVQKHFADLNIELLRGNHILLSKPALFALLDQYEGLLDHYYKTLYGLNLQKRSHDNETYYYLEFPEVGKGKLTNPNLYAELDAKTTIVGFVLANLYYTSYFSYDKKFRWDDIKYEIEHGEHKDAYQGLFFKEIKSEYSEKQWAEVKKQFSSVINFFSRIQLVEKDDLDEDIHFTILPTIHHFIELYQSEIENTDEFLKEIKLTS